MKFTLTAKEALALTPKMKDNYDRWERYAVNKITEMAAAGMTSCTLDPCVISPTVTHEDLENQKQLLEEAGYLTRIVAERLVVNWKNG